MSYDRHLAAFAILVLATGNSGAQDKKPTAPQLVWEFQTPGVHPQSLQKDARGKPYLYVALKTGGVSVLDLSKPDAKPEQAAKIGCDVLAGLDVMYLTQRESRLYLALGDFFNNAGSKAGLAIVDVADPRSPKVLSVWTSEETLKGSAFVLVEGDVAYLGVMNHGVMIFDVADPKKPHLLSTILPDVHFPTKDPKKTNHPNARGLAIRKNLLYVANDAGGLRVIDVADKKKPKELSRYINSAMLKKQQAYNNVVLHENYAYIAVDYAGLEIVDIRDPKDIRGVGWWNPWNADTLANLWFNSPGHTNQLVLDPRKKLAYLSAGDSELQVVDVADPKHPKLAAGYGEPKNKRGVWGLTLDDRRVYLAYITSIIPFQSNWVGIKAVSR